MLKSFTSGGNIVWRPSQHHIARSHLHRFMTQHGLHSYSELHERSVQDIAWFTNAVLSYLDIQFEQPYSRVVDTSNGIQNPVWCVGGKLNIVHNCVDKWLANPESRNRVAISWEGEEGSTQTLTYGELSEQVNQCSNAIRQLGLGKGDVIGVHMPMTPEICVAVLAIARVGAVILPLFSGYGISAIASRLEDARAKALFTADGLFRRGRIVDMKSVADQAIEHVPTLQHVVVLRRTGADVVMQDGRDYWWHEFILTQSTEATLESTFAEDLLMIIYTSGTTGRPKGAVHTHCSFPVKAAQDMAFGTDVHAGDTIYWITDMGWMMGPWLVFGATLLGATCFLYDGAPDYPASDRLWSLVERHRINVLGLSPSLIRGLMPGGEEPVRRHDLSSLHLFASTGEPWNPAPWMWLFEVVGRGRLPIINYSGGTEIAGGILMGNTLLPLKPTAFSAACPGMAADVVDAQGHSVRGDVGELVIRSPWIGMTRGFWEDNQRYIETYWSRFPDVWLHGDWAAIDQDGLWYILGRSDDTLKVAGKRIGPAEVESVLVGHPSVTEAAAIGVPDEIKGNAVVCFCVLTPDAEPSEALRLELESKITVEMGKPLRPKDVRFVTDLPKTRNAKVMRRVIRAAYLGEDPGDISSLVNPETVHQIPQAR